MPRYKDHEWGDEGYDAIDYLLDNDPIELARLVRSFKSALSMLVASDRPPNLVKKLAALDEAESVLREFNEATEP